MNHDERAELWQRIKQQLTPYQCEVFSKVWAAVRATLERERVTFAYFADDGNDAFLDNVERVLVEGMANGSEPQPPASEPQHLNPAQGEPDGGEYRPTYWWQD